METENIFTITPMSHNINLEAGETYTGYITVANPANATTDFNYKATITSFNVVGEDYTVDFATQYNRSQIVNWIKLENAKGTLAPNETAEIKFTITVPESAPAGGQYAAIIIGSNDEINSSEGVNIQNVFEMASIIYAKVAGETIRKGEISEITAPGFVTQSPIPVSATITNDGNSHEVARISLEVKSFFSASPIYPAPDEDGTINEVIMPETTRLVTRNIEGISPLGIYEVKEVINYLGETKTFSQTIVSCPIWFIALVLVTIAAIIVAAVRTIRLHRARRKVF